jgi:hypothetical protein
VFLHIGEPKSGSSYLQALMWANQSFLRRHGILLPGRGPVDHYQAGSDLQGDPVRDGGSRRPEAWQWLVDRIDVSDSRAAIISDERLTRTRAAPVRRALDSLGAHDVRVILAIREYGGLVASEWQQVVKMGGTARLEEWLERLVAGGLRQFWRTHDVGDVLRRWSVPREHVHVLIVPQAGADRNELWRRFASIVGAPAELPTAASRSNASMGLDETELVRRLYEQFAGPPPPGPIQSVMRGVVSRQILSPRDGARSIRLPDACLPWIEEQAEQRKAVVASSGCRIVGDVDELDIDRSRFVPAIEQPESARVLDAATDVIDVVTRRIDRRGKLRVGVHSEPAGNGNVFAAGAASPVRHAAAVLRTSVRAAWSTGRRRDSGTDGAGRTFCLIVSPPATGADRVRRLLWRNRAGLTTAGVFLADAARPWRGLIRDAERSGRHAVVVTDRRLVTTSADEVAELLELLDGADVRVVYVLRDVTTLLPAVWAEQARSRPTPAWSDWLDAMMKDPAAVPGWPAHDVDQVLARWRQGGVEHVDLLVHPKAAEIDTALWERMRTIVGWPASTPVALSDRSDHPGHSQVELLRRVQARLDARRLHHVAEVAATLDPFDCITFPESSRPWIEANTERRRAAAAERRNDVVGDVADLEPSAAAFTATASRPDDAAVLDAAVPLSARLVEELAGLRAGARPARRGRLVAGLRRLA